MPSDRRWKIIFLLCYIALIVYGSLFPFTGWRMSSDGDMMYPFTTWPRHVSKADLVTNLLAYIPLGYLCVRTIRRNSGAITVLVAATLIGTMLSGVMEFFQVFLPSRVSSMVDIILNGTGTLLGALIALGTAENAILGRQLEEYRYRWFLSDRDTDVGLAIVGLWGLSQLMPLVPSLDIANLKHGLKPLWHTLHDPSTCKPAETAVYVLNIAGLGGIAAMIIRDRKHVTALFSLFVATVLLLKVPIIGRQLSMEAVFGFAAGMILLSFVRRFHGRIPAAIAALCILTALVIDELRPANAENTVLYPFNWYPLRGQMANLAGFESIVEGIWPFSALAYIASAIYPQNSLSVPICLGLCLMLLVFILEWQQQFIPGRYPDITAVFLAGIGWIMPWVYIEKSGS